MEEKVNNILGFNPSHHGSVCLLQKGDIKAFIEEERITRQKYKGYPFKSFINLLQNYEINHLAWASPGLLYPINHLEYDHFLENSIPIWLLLASSYQSSQNIDCSDLSIEFHHTVHAAHAFYNSGFDEALAIVVDGSGSGIKKDYQNKEHKSSYKCSYPDNFIPVEKLSFGRNSPNKEYVSDCRSYEGITHYLGWNRNEAGKTMGLSSYGKYDKNIPSFLGKQKHKVWKNIWDDPESLGDLELNISNFPYLKLKTNPKEWHKDPSKITDLEKNIAWRIQYDTQKHIGDFIERSIKKTGLKKVCCSGGYFLNCVANYHFKKRFPDIEFYFEPVSNDAGTAIGASKLVWHHVTQDTTIRPQKSVYYGPEYTKEQLLKDIQKYI